MGWYVAPCLNTLLGEFNSKFPNRSKAADGSIGDASHQARPSDHNPAWSAGGVVRARDITHDPANGCDVHKEFRKPELQQDPRTKYDITNGKIISSYAVGGYPPYAERPYHGINAHRQHAHKSIKSGRIYEDDKSPWYGVSQEDKLDEETKRKFEEIDKDFEAIKEALGDDYGKSISASLFKQRRNPDGTPVLNSSGKKVYDEHLNVLEAKIDEMYTVMGELSESVKELLTQRLSPDDTGDG